MNLSSLDELARTIQAALRLGLAAQVWSALMLTVLAGALVALASRRD